MTSTTVNTRRVMVACALAGLAIVNTNLIVAQEAPPAGKPADTGGFVPPQPMSNNPFHIDESTGGGPAAKRTNLTKDGRLIDDLPAGSFETVENGYRRVRGSMTRTLTAEQIAELAAAGKAVKGDQQVMDTFTDQLPVNWMIAPANVPAGARVDSYGNPIVNSVPALPDWAQRDVDALRAAIANLRLHVINLDLALAGQVNQIQLFPPRRDASTYLRSAEDLSSDRMESAHSLGNLVGQTFVRGIDIADIMQLDDAMLTGEVVHSIAQYLHFYESERMREAMKSQQAYAQSVYPPQVTGLLAAHGHAMQDVLMVANPDEGGIAGAGGCYNVTAPTVGWTELTGATIIWDGGAGTFDDLSSDVPIGFRYYYNPCEDLDDNFNVRVSTNGYLSFFEQGGGALDGTDLSNDVLPSANDPDGFIAPWWDDMLITSQGTTDRVSYKTEGSTGFRVFTVEWFSVSRFGGDTTEFHYFQAKLFENDNQIQFDYDTLWIADSVDDSTIGIEDFAGDDADCGPNCGNLNAAAPTTNFTFDYPAPSNNFCSDAICLEEDEEVFGTTFGASGSDISSCASNDFADVWYSYTAPDTGSTTVTLCTGGNQYDATLSVHSGGCGVLTDVACDDDFCALFGPSQVSFAAVSGTTYLLRVSGYSGARGTFRISADSGNSGDVCATCHPVSPPGTGTFFTTNNLGCDDETACAFVDTVDEWFCFTPAVSGVYRASTCTPVADFDTTLAVFTGSCGLLVQRACNDDAPPFCNGELTSRVLWVADAGTTYRIRVAGFNGAVGNYELALSLYGCPADIAPQDYGDGIVDVDDMLAVINAWGACSSCRADFVPAGGNNTVNVDDLLGVINAWGSCP